MFLSPIDLLPDKGWDFLATCVVSVVGAAVTIHQTHKAKTSADEAAALSRPTGNGFAETVKTSLFRIESKLDDHIAEHASAQIHQREQ